MLQKWVKQAGKAERDERLDKMLSLINRTLETLFHFFSFFLFIEIQLRSSCCFLLWEKHFLLFLFCFQFVCLSLPYCWLAKSILCCITSTVAVVFSIHKCFMIDDQWSVGHWSGVQIPRKMFSLHCQPSSLPLLSSLLFPLFPQQLKLSFGLFCFPPSLYIYSEQTLQGTLSMIDFSWGVFLCLSLWNSGWFRNTSNQNSNIFRFGWKSTGMRLQ